MARRAGRLYGPAYDGLFRLQQEAGEAEVNRRLRDLDRAVTATAQELKAPVGQDLVLRQLFEPEVDNSAAAPSPRQAAVTLNDGGLTVTLDAAGNLHGLGSLLSRTKQALTAALKNPGSVVPGSVMRQFRPQPAMLMSGGSRVAARAAFILLRPVATAVMGAHPVFVWEPYPDAIRYQVTLFAGGKDVLTSGPLSASPEPAWQPEQPLAPNLYSWQVSAFTQSGTVSSPVPPAPEAAFRVLTPDKADALRRARESHAGSLLTQGVLYARAGLLDEAETAFEALLAANPDAPVARQLLQSVHQAHRPGERGATVSPN